MVKNQNHPKKGSTIKVGPIKRRKDIKTLTKLLGPRDLCLFTVGVNTALRASDLVKIRTEQIKDIEPMDDIEIKEKKVKKYKRINLNEQCVESIRTYMDSREVNSEWLFDNSQGGHLSVPYVSGLVKGWCRSINLKGNYGSHTLRKTFGYMQRTRYDIRIPILMTVFNHSTERQTLEYLCIQPEEVKNIYQNPIT